MSRDFIQYAIKKAKKIPHVRGRQRHYCVISDKRGRILSQAQNTYDKSSPKMKNAAINVGIENKTFWHAECLALHKLHFTSEPYKISIVRINAKNKAMMSKPCKICSEQIKKHGIKVIEYSTGE